MGDKPDITARDYVICCILYTYHFVKVMVHTGIVPTYPDCPVGRGLIGGFGVF